MKIKSMDKIFIQSVFACLVVFLIVISNLFYLDSFPLASYKLYTSVAKEERFNYYVELNQSGVLEKLPFQHPLYYPFNRYRFTQLLLWMDGFYEVQNNYQKQNVLNSNSRRAKRLQSQVSYVKKRLCEFQNWERNIDVRIYLIINKGENQIKFSEDIKVIIKTKNYESLCVS